MCVFDHIVIRVGGHRAISTYAVSIAMPQEQEALQAEISAMLGTVSLANLRRIKAKLEKRKLPTTRTSCCKPRTEPFAAWKPKHAGIAKRALELIHEGAGLKSAPFIVKPDDWAHKFFASSVAERIVHDENNSSNDMRSEMAKTSITVASLTARIVEEASALKSVDPERFGNAHLEMQGSRDDAGWSKATTRGSGVLMNAHGKDLFALAAERVKTRLCC